MWIYWAVIVKYSFMHLECQTSQVKAGWASFHDTLAWATGTRVGADDHAIAFFCIEYGCVLGLYFDTLHFEV